MRRPLLRSSTSAWALLAPLVGAGCFLFAAGAGAGGAIYFSDRGVESLVAAPADQVRAAAVRTFEELGIAESRTSVERDGGAVRHRLEGSTAEREITVTLRTEGDATRVEVIARRSAITWDKDFARQILERIVRHAG